MSLSGLVSTVAGTRPFGWALAGLERATRWPANDLTVLTYHRIEEPLGRPDRAPGLVSATPDELDRQMAYLAEHADVIDVDDLLAARRGTRRLGPRSVLVTFDDAVDDFAVHAWPVLRRHRIPVVLFVPTGYPDTHHRPFWWDRLHHALGQTTASSVTTPVGPLHLRDDEDRRSAYRRLRDEVKQLPHGQAMELVDQVVSALGDPGSTTSVLSWAQLRELAADGVALAPHSRSHAMLDRVEPDQLRDEVEGSLHDLEQALGAGLHAAPLFAYPSGQHDPRVVETVAAAGYEGAFTTERGHNLLDDVDWYRLRRVNVGGRTQLPLVRAQLHPLAGRILERTGSGT